MHCEPRPSTTKLPASSIRSPPPAPRRRAATAAPRAPARSGPPQRHSSHARRPEQQCACSLLLRWRRVVRTAAVILFLEQYMHVHIFLARVMSGSCSCSFRALCFALRASYFFLLRQEKVTKKKATPGAPPPLCGGSLRCSGRRGGCATRPLSGPQTVLADITPSPLCCSAAHKGTPTPHTLSARAPASPSPREQGEGNERERKRKLGIDLPPPGRRRAAQPSRGEVGEHCLSARRARVAQPPRDGEQR